MATASPLPISMNEYLHTSYQPDCDYVDGIVEARNVGAPEHSRTQHELVAYCNSRNWGVRAVPEVRIQTSASHVRVADVALISGDGSRDEVVETPPVAVIEVLSPEDMPHQSERIEDYRRMGIKCIWVIDPSARKGFDCSSDSWVETEHFAAPESPVRIDLPAFFAAVDSGRAR